MRRTRAAAFQSSIDPMATGGRSMPGDGTVQTTMMVVDNTSDVDVRVPWVQYMPPACPGPHVSTKRETKPLAPSLPLSSSSNISKRTKARKGQNEQEMDE